MTQLFTEVFDSDSEKNYPVINLSPKDKVPQIWSIKAPGNENLVARMVSYTSEGDAIKKVKQGDKYAHVILMSLSAKGTPAELKGGLGSDPIGALNTIFDTVYADVKKLKMDAVLFRFPAKKMKGQERILQRVMNRIVAARTGSRFKVLDALYQYTGKHAYILIYRKSKPLEDISGIPGINADLYTKVESAVGDVYVSKESGTQVTKDEAIAGSIDAVEKKRSDRSAITRTKINRRALAQSQSLESDSFVLKDWEELDASAIELSKPAAGPIINDIESLNALVNSKAVKDRTATDISRLFAQKYQTSLLSDEPEVIFAADKINKKLKLAFSDKSLTSMAALQALTKTISDNVADLKPMWFKKMQSMESGYVTPAEHKAYIDKQWVEFKADTIKGTLAYYGDQISKSMRDFTESRTGEYAPAEKRAIKEYVSSSYLDINQYLLGRYNPKNYDVLDEQEVVKAIKGMDSAFENGDRLPADYTLYRAQSMRLPIFNALKTNRRFYFRNYVSTSLKPIIFGGWSYNVALAFVEPTAKEDIAINIGQNDEYIDTSVPKVNGYTRVNIGWAITGVNKINVIYPGSLSLHTSEAEIILPRGTVVEIKSITDASHDAGNKILHNQKLIQAEILNSEELNENATVYDGDVLFETGELKIYSDFEAESSSDFLAPETTASAMRILASFMDLEDIPEKYTIG